MTNEIERRTAFIQSLRDCADFLEQHPDVTCPCYVNLNVFVRDRDELTTIARAGSWEKIHNSEWFYLRKTFSDDLTLDFATDRDLVCRKVVTGTRVIPAQPARVVEDVEWVCDEPLLAGGAQ